MYYKILPHTIPQHKREEINQKILLSLETGEPSLKPEEVFNRYTGVGGIHHLKREDFDSYHAYSEAKKEIENGQFFTPHPICKQMVELIKPSSKELILEMCCGMGNFFNYFPNLSNAYGFDIDPSAIQVAEFLYPAATIKVCDMAQYQSKQRFDLIIGNPPFNLKTEREKSQSYYCKKAYKLLNPMGFFMFIVPATFLTDEFHEQRMISLMNEKFSFVGQTELPSDAFKAFGVDSYSTRIMVFTRHSTHIMSNPYKPKELITPDELAQRIEKTKKQKKSLRVKLLIEATHLHKDELEHFDYISKKYLYEIKNQRKLKKYYQRSTALVAELISQQPPENCTYEEFKEWDRHKLTPEKVLATLKKYIRNQNVIHRKEIAIVKTAYDIRLKAYAPRLLKKNEKKSVSINDLILGKATLPEPEALTEKNRQQISALTRLIGKKRRAYKRQSQNYKEMAADPFIENYLCSQSFLNRDYKRCYFTDLQKFDLGLVFQKKYNLLNWQQGSGKTAASYAYARYLLKFRKVKNVIVLAPAIATNLTWLRFLQVNGEEYYVLRNFKDFDHVPEGVFIVVPSSMLQKLKKPLKKLLKLRSNKMCLVFDESDEITNPASQRTRNTLDIFRRLSYKLLATGTTTRNNINELYSQVELLYNNSVNMLCTCDTIYRMSKEKEIESERNPYEGLPFPAYTGHNLFKHCFCPSKATVFGIEKVNQDIYNKDHLAELISKTIITRKFREFAGEKYTIFNRTVKPSAGENEVYRVISDEFFRICELYYTSTGNARKDAGLRLIRQIKLLIKACSVPQSIDGYFGDPYPTKAYKIKQLIEGIPEKVAVGCTTLESLKMYKEFLTDQFPDRPLFVISGSISFTKREKIIAEFESTVNGILISTQQSLKNSVNIPSCNHVIVEALQWNLPVMEQYYFRFIRLDSKHNTNVYYVTYEDSIEQNLMLLVLSKERLNEFVGSLEVKDQSEIFNEFDVCTSILDQVVKKNYDQEGKLYLTWGSQQIAS